MKEYRSKRIERENSSSGVDVFRKKEKKKKPFDLRKSKRALPSPFFFRSKNDHF
jgi:hypothetical protein